MNFFFIIFFEGLDAGWSEVYPISAGSITTAVSIAANTNTTRLAMLCNDMFQIGVRLSQAEIKGDSYPTSIPANQPGTFGTPTDKTYQRMRTCLRTVGRSADGLHRGSRFFRGIPQDQLTDGAYAPTTPFTTAVNAMLTLLSNGTFNLASRNKTPPPVWNFIPATAHDPVQITERKIGRPFNLFRGRRLIA